MLVLMKKAVSNKYIFILLLALTSFSSQWGTPIQVVGDDTRDPGTGDRPFKSSSYKNFWKKYLPLGELKKMFAILKQNDRPEVGESNRLPSILEEGDGYKRGRAYILARSGYVNGVKQKSSLDDETVSSSDSFEFSLDDKTLSPSDLLKSSVDDKTLPSSDSLKSPILRRKNALFHWLFDGKDGGKESSSLSSNGKTDGVDTTETPSPLSDVQNHNDMANESDQIQPKLTRMKGGRHEDLLSKPRLTKTFGIKHPKWAKLRMPKIQMLVSCRGCKAE